MLVKCHGGAWWKHPAGARAKGPATVRHDEGHLAGALNRASRTRARPNWWPAVRIKHTAMPVL